ncbi:MAG: efflux RND transporter periplasmic adaptor subunit [Candidatus Kapabacteria bacterium]|jgi:RND family efflux transporter MFP subunit|nr:efflux RND transporter periplasmic adaptor subunit [Candidatus Kapabacteria bacterium]
MKTIRFTAPLLAAASMLLVQACSSDSQSATSQPADNRVPVHVTVLTPSHSTNEATASGVVFNDAEQHLGFKVGGIVRTVTVREGDRVRAGQLLASLASTEIDAMVDQAREGYNKAERDVRRVEALFADSVATLEQLQNVRTARSVAKNQLDIAEYNKQHSEIRATTHGIVLRRTMEPGEVAAPGAPVLVIAGNNASTWLVRVGVADNVWSRLRVGSTARVNFQALGSQTFPGRIRSVGAASDRATGLYPIDITLDAPPATIATGLFATATLQLNRQPESSTTTIVPMNAILEGNGDIASVFVVSAGKAKKVSVSIAAVLPQGVQLAAPLPSDSLITGGSAYVVDGSPVAISSHR